jgi:ABC-type branched-subunit amino acid transport system permease subunit
MTRRNAMLAAVAIGLALLLLPFVAGLAGNAWIRIMAFAMLYVMLALGLNIVVGYAGLLDLGYIAFYAVGAYMYALLASPHLFEQFEWIRQTFPDGLHNSIWLVIPLSAILAAMFGVLLGMPTLRLRGDYLAIVTLGFGEIIRIFLNNLNAPVNLTNGPQGISNIDPIQIGQLNLARSADLFGITIPSVQLYYYLFLVLTVIVIVITVRLQDSRVGRAWIAIREDEIAAKAMGINTRNVKLLSGLRVPREFRADGKHRDCGHGGSWRYGICAWRGAWCDPALRDSRVPPLYRQTAPGGDLRHGTARAGSIAHAALRPRDGDHHAVSTAWASGGASRAMTTACATLHGLASRRA